MKKKLYKVVITRTQRSYALVAAVDKRDADTVARAWQYEIESCDPTIHEFKRVVTGEVTGEDDIFQEMGDHAEVLDSVPFGEENERPVKEWLK